MTDEYKRAEDIIRFYSVAEEEIRLLQSQNGPDIEFKIEKIRKVKQAIYREIDCLSPWEKIIIIRFYINNEQWLPISSRLHYSIRQCKRIRTAAIDKLQKRFLQVEEIKSYFS